MPDVSFEDLVTNADQIVSGTVLKATVSWGSEHKYIWTRYTIAVGETLKGAPAQKVVVSEPGGTLDGQAMSVVGSVAYTAGERVMLFLQTYATGEKRTVGWAQGKLRFDRSGRVRSAVMSLDGLRANELRSRVAAAVRKGSVQ